MEGVLRDSVQKSDLEEKQKSRAIENLAQVPTIPDENEQAKAFIDSLVRSWLSFGVSIEKADVLFMAARDLTEKTQNELFREGGYVDQIIHEMVENGTPETDLFRRAIDFFWDSTTGEDGLNRLLAEGAFASIPSEAKERVRQEVWAGTVNQKLALGDQCLDPEMRAVAQDQWMTLCDGRLARGEAVAELSASDLRSGVQLSAVEGNVLPRKPDCVNGGQNCSVGLSQMAVYPEDIDSSVLIEEKSIAGVVGRYLPLLEDCALGKSECSFFPNQGLDLVDAAEIQPGSLLRGSTLLGVAGTWSPDFPDTSSVLSTDTVQGMAGRIIPCQAATEYDCFEAERTSLDVVAELDLSDTGAQPLHMLFADQFIYVHARERILVLDAKDPSDLRIIHNLDTPEGRLSVTGAVSRTHWLVGVDVDGFHIYSIADLLNSPSLSSYDETSGWIEKIFWGRKLYIAYGNGGLLVLDISDTTNPVKNFTVQHPNGSGSGRGPSAVFEHKKYLYVGYLGVYKDLQVFDATDLQNISPVGSFAESEGVADVKVFDDRAYLATLAGGLKILDVTSPAAPTLLGHLAFESPVYSIAQYDRTRLAVRTQQFVHLVDIANSMEPKLIASMDLQDTATRFAQVSVSKGLIAVGTAAGKVLLLQLRRPGSLSPGGN